jgi:hypothetical protein
VQESWLRNPQVNVEAKCRFLTQETAADRRCREFQRARETYRCITCRLPEMNPNAWRGHLETRGHYNRSILEVQGTTENVLSLAGSFTLLMVSRWF